MTRVNFETNPDPLPETPIPQHAPAAADFQVRLDRPWEQGARGTCALNGLSTDWGLKRFDVDDDVRWFRRGVTPRVY